MGLQLDGVPKGASEHTEEKNSAVYTLLNFDGQQEFEFAEKGLLAAPEHLEIFDEAGKLVWS